MYSFMETEGATKTRVLAARSSFYLSLCIWVEVTFVKAILVASIKSGLNTHGTYLSSSQATLHQTDYQSETGRN